MPDNSILITANMQSETGFPSSHQLKSYVAYKCRLKLAARAVLSADASLLVLTRNRGLKDERRTAVVGRARPDERRSVVSLYRPDDAKLTNIADKLLRKVTTTHGGGEFRQQSVEMSGGATDHARQ